MSLVLANVGGSLTGGSSQTFTYAGSPVAGKVSYVSPTHTRLTPRQLDLTMSNATTTSKDPGVAKSGAKITFGDRSVESGCCTVSQGNVIIDLNLRWSLNQPEALVDEAIDALQALVFSTSFIDALKKGILPN